MMDYSKKGFTLAEVLITLAIVGVVAAMTIPTIISKYEKVQTISKLKKINSLLSQIALKASWDNGSVNAFLKSNEAVSAARTEQFFDKYWIPYLKSIVVSPDGVCPYSVFKPYLYLNGTLCDVSVFTRYSAGRIFFTNSDGVVFFIVTTVSDYVYDEEGNLVQQNVKYGDVQQVYVDLNGVNGPNKHGKDIFRFVIDFSKNNVEPYGYQYSKSYLDQNCSEIGTGIYCMAKIIRDGWKIADDYPW